VKISIDPMPAYRDGAAVKVNAHFTNLASLSAMQESAWKRKREIARAVKAGDCAGMAIAKEAELRGLTPAQLADLILSKLDPMTLADARELQRQTALLAIDAAKTPAELNSILAGLNHGA
jgi:hypothetical protein